MAEGFLGRWSQRKQALRAGRTLAEPVLPLTPAALDALGTNDPTLGQPQASVLATPGPDKVNQGSAAEPGVPARPAQDPPLSLDDVQRLTTESDFKPFVARGVSPEVRNAAMKKLFTDPHYNLMDRLDIYIDDYSQPDPLPPSMLRQMASAQFLNLFEEEKTTPTPLGDDADTRVADSVAQSAQPLDAGVETPIENPPPAPGQDHDHTDLRLQPNDAPRRQEPGRGTE